jgi:hypothetical protein
MARRGAGYRSGRTPEGRSGPVYIGIGALLLIIILIIIFT